VSLPNRLVASAIYNLQLQEADLGCHTADGMLLIAMYMSSYQQLYAIRAAIKEDEVLLKRI
jgi:hypothetical protein